jgi:hypothetical protein
LAITGRIPELEATVHKLFERNAAFDTFSVALEHDGQHALVTFSRNGSGSVSRKTHGDTLQWTVVEATSDMFWASPASLARGLIGLGGHIELPEHVRAGLPALGNGAPVETCADLIRLDDELAESEKQARAELAELETCGPVWGAVLRKLPSPSDVQQLAERLSGLPDIGAIRAPKRSATYRLIEALATVLPQVSELLDSVISLQSQANTNVGGLVNVTNRMSEVKRARQQIAVALESAAKHVSEPWFGEATRLLNAHAPTPLLLEGALALDKGELVVRTGNRRVTARTLSATEQAFVTVALALASANVVCPDEERMVILVDDANRLTPGSQVLLTNIVRPFVERGDVLALVFATTPGDHPSDDYMFNVANAKLLRMEE